jgi:hypothetical protein
MAGDLSGQGYAHLFASLACSIRGERAEAVTQSGQAMRVGARLEQAEQPSPPG